MPAIPRTLFDKRLITLLGYAGILPMLLCVMLLDWSLSLPLLKGYSLSIIAFLAGAWWSTALMHRRATPAEVRRTLLLSNITVLTAVASVIFLGNEALLVLAALFGCLLWGESRLPVFAEQPDYYRGMRIGVTAVVVALHLVAFVLAS